VVQHLHPRDILLHPRGLELVLPVGQEVVDEVLHLASVATTPRGDGLPGYVSHNITIRCPVGWPRMPVDHLGPVQDLHDGMELHPSRTQESLDMVLVVIPKCPSRA
jgi:hypothetical protein